MLKMVEEKPSLESYEKALDSLKVEREQTEKGYRRKLYELIGQSAHIALLIESNDNICTQFREKCSTNDVLRASLDLVFDPKTLLERKENSKRTIAVRYLIDKLNIDPEKVASELRKQGGIEKIARRAAADDCEGDEHANGNAPKGGDGTINRAQKNELGRSVLVTFSPKLGKKLSRFGDNVRLRMIGYYRTSLDESPSIDVRKIVKLPPRKKVEKDLESDWED
jgi:hypothetical protein